LQGGRRGVGHRLLAGGRRVQVVTGVVREPELAGVRRVGECPVEVDDPVDQAALSQGGIDSLSAVFARGAVALLRGVAVTAVRGDGGGHDPYAVLVGGRDESADPGDDGRRIVLVG